tara:strand:+ start:167 stop:391 length:225 start_codon:yes stop_codon:yes gene_type:complete
MVSLSVRSDYLKLGINDTKVTFERDIIEILEGMAEKIDLVRSISCGPNMQGLPQIFVLSLSALTHEGYVHQNNE